MAEADIAYSQEIYNELLQNPLTVLKNFALEVKNLPHLDCAERRCIGFAATDGLIIIDHSSDMASDIIGVEGSAVKLPMIVSSMRSLALPVGAGLGGRHRAAGIIDVSVGAENLWVTEIQTGCTTLVLDWGANNYSFLHLQPSKDDQFNRLGQRIMGFSDFSHDLYKNVWLKRELTTIIGNTARTPQRYAMVQSLFENARRTSTQVVGIRNKTEFIFYRQRQIGKDNVVEQLQWSSWSSYLPFFSY
ncbi:hypothetical protein [Pseudomonas syringae group genomosp. 3]|uniref:hypothetical protein n=1 Tax=Pseudomonas syringae group genomosp. 3 TaxID=251701 RepID=UPI0005C82AEF|nr:hypothetical protein [Pseudomonas syringae group genomosp. 3]